MGGYTFQSFFDGYGRMHRFELQDGQVCFTAKMMNTAYYKEAELLGRPASTFFMGTEPPLPGCPLTHPMCKVTGAAIDNNWVNLMPTSSTGEGLLLTDSPIFLRFDYDTMAVSGSYPWKDGGLMPTWLKKFHVPATGSAHPVHRPKTDSTWIEVMLEVGLTKAIAVYTIDIKTMDRALLAHVPVKGMMYFHSFGASENYVVLPCNLKLSPGWKSLLNFEDGWDGIHVVDRSGNVQVFDTEKFFHYHIANTFENDTGIVMDIGTLSTLPFQPQFLKTANQLNRTQRDISPRGMTERIHMHLSGPKKGQVTRELLGLPGRANDFLKVNHHVWGLPYCIYYAVEWFHDDKDFTSMAVLKHNVCEGTRDYWSKPNSYPGEPYFLPRGSGTFPAAEDDGLVLFVVLDGVRKASNFVILDGKSFQESAVIELPVHIPFTAHGQFIPKDGRQAVQAALEVAHPEIATAVETFLTV